MTYAVIHQPEQARFVITLAAGEAVLAYRLQGLAVDFYSTYVPEQLRGHGLAERLVRTGLRWARQESLQVNASCWYVAKFLR